MSDQKALTQLDVQIAESKTAMWLAGGTVVAIVLAIVGLPAVSAVLVPQMVVQGRSAFMSWRRMRERRAAEAREFS